MVDVLNGQLKQAHACKTEQLWIFTASCTWIHQVHVQL